MCAEAPWTVPAGGLPHRILALPAPVTADAVRVSVEQSRGPSRLAPVTLHRSRAVGGWTVPARPGPPVVAPRARGAPGRPIR
ncbi:hypothetical protein Scani_62110 [Streptomyces caniferus]|uniref:Uncharacterized protein n=1 Tax=Streptomyces caniferus TaxID=285557 RepID=A0A640SEV9_9ACTN|nr:hypothetical protein Scani_62110 [Streptomyces caniferus]